MGSKIPDGDKVDPNHMLDTEQGLTILHSASFYGKVKPMKALIEKFKADPTLPDYRGQSPLHITTLAGKL